MAKEPMNSTGTDLCEVYRQVKNYWNTLKAFPSSDISSEYCPSDKGNCIICQVEPDGENLVYIIDADKRNSYKAVFEDLQMDMMKDVHKRPMSSLRNEELVGVQIDKYNTRALVEEDSNGRLQVFLIDLGEYLENSASIDFFFDLPERYRYIPAVAKLAQVHGIPTQAPVELYLQSQFSKLTSFEVVAVVNDVLHINITSGAPVSVSNNDDLGSLKQDDSSSSNALIAVMNYAPKDDVRLCKFYDERTGGCFKGITCKLVHLPKMEDGWTRDKTKVFVNTLVELPRPAIGQKLLISVTFVVSPTVFYAQINPGEKGARNTMTIANLQRAINQESNVQKLKHYSKNIRPCSGELVLARYRKDGNIYRAKVMHPGDTKLVIFYIDYGNMDEVDINDVYQWSADFQNTYGCLPPQAIRFTLAGLRAIEGKENSAIIAKFEKRFLNERLKVTIM